MRILDRRRIAVLLVAAALLLAVVALVRSGDEPITITADFEDTTGLYVGNEVVFLGVPIGTVTRIDPAGTTMKVHMEIEAGTELPAEAGATILQSSLVTDRYVELGPAYTGGPVLASGAHIEASHTRSPANMDQIIASIDELVLALDSTTPNGKDIGDLLEVAARTFDGNGDRVREAMIAGEDALRTINNNSDDILAVTANLATLVDAVAARDTTIRRLSASLARTSDVVAEQRQDVTGTLAALDQLTGVVDEFITTNREVVADDLAGALEVIEVIRGQQDSLTEAFDTMPTLAENMTRAYDQRTGRLRVQFSTETGPFSAIFRDQVCRQLNLPACELLFTPDGSGLLDPLFDAIGDAIPGDFP